MPGKRTPSKGKKINPHFWVFCEGETEESYIHLLRSKYRIPISIRIIGNNVSKRRLDSYKVGKPADSRDKDFLIYDADVKHLTDKLKVLNAELILSNPGIELWFLFHYKNQTAEITVEECIRKLCNHNKNSYKKGFIDSQLENKLLENCGQACSRSSKSKYPENPSSNFDVFIKELERVSSGKRV